MEGTYQRKSCSDGKLANPHRSAVPGTRYKKSRELVESTFSSNFYQIYTILAFFVEKEYKNSRTTMFSILQRKCHKNYSILNEEMFCNGLLPLSIQPLPSYKFCILCFH